MTLFSWMERSRPVGSNAFGWICLQVGLFVLPASVFIAGLFLLPALVLGSFRRSISYWRDYWNYPFLIAAFLMLIGCVRAYSGWLAWVGLANWLPFFWGFWAFQPYLMTAEARRRCALWLLAGTVPVVITGLGQLWLGWNGPWQLLNGLVVWFVAPGGQPIGRLSGLFDYANIAGAWLAIIWPFSLAALLQPFLNRLQRCVVLMISVGIVAALVLTDSRSAWSALVLGVPFVLGPARWIWLLPLMIVMFIPLGFAVLPGIDLELQSWARKFVPENIWSRLNDMKFVGKRHLAHTRLFQWQEAINLVAERPWLGWGAAAFSVLFPLRTGFWLGHAHNLPLEIAVSHGLPVMVLIVVVVLGLLMTALKRQVLTMSYKKGDSLGIAVFDRAWWTACLIIVSMHAVDMPFFDSRLNIAGWVLLSGLRCLAMSSVLTQHDGSKLVVDA